MLHKIYRVSFILLMSRQKIGIKILFGLQEEKTKSVSKILRCVCFCRRKTEFRCIACNQRCYEQLTLQVCVPVTGDVTC